MGVLGDEFAVHSEVEDGLAQLLDVLRAGGEARQVIEDEAGVVAEGVCLPGWQVGRVGFCRVGGGVQAVQAGRHQPVAALLPLRFRRLQLVAQSHQFVHLGDDAVLLGERREGNWHPPKVTNVYALKGNTFCLARHP